MHDSNTGAKINQILVSLSQLGHLEVIYFESKMSKSKKSSPEPEEGNEEYIVEKIIDSRINEHGVKEYLLKWIG